MLGQRTLDVGAVLLAGFAALRLVTRTVVWLLPYNLAGLVSEGVILATGCAVASLWCWRSAAAAVSRARRVPAAVIAGTVSYLALSFAGAGWDGVDGAGFGRNGFYVFSTQGCEFVARFPSPPDLGRLAAATAPRVARGAYAVLADLPSVSSLRADCLSLGNPGPPSGRTSNAEVLLRRWAEEDRVRIERSFAIEQPGFSVFQIEGSIGGSVLPDAADGKPRRTFVVARAHVGERSVLVLGAYQALDQTVSPRTRDFLDSAAMR